MANKLTIGMAVYDDYNGVYFTIQSIRANMMNYRFSAHTHKEIDFVVVDNNPESDQGKATCQFCKNVGVNYVPYSTVRGTAAAKNQVFKHAQTDWAMCVDSHVILNYETVDSLLSFANNDVFKRKTLYHGRLVLDKFNEGYDYMDPVWRGGMYGVWGDPVKIHEKANSSDSSKENPEDVVTTVFGGEIPMHGMGLFLMHREDWPEFHEDMTGFGGEEGYIHEKVRAQGGEIMLAPNILWVHRFHNQGLPTAYPNFWHERIRNYYIGFVVDLHRGDMWRDCVLHFKEHLSEQDYERVQNKLLKDHGIGI